MHNFSIGDTVRSNYRPSDAGDFPAKIIAYNAGGDEFLLFNNNWRNGHNGTDRSNINSFDHGHWWVSPGELTLHKDPGPRWG